MNKAIAIFLAFFFSCANAFAHTKDADLAGSWYSADKDGLSATLDKYLNAASPPAVEGKIIAIISPHAGLVYSGPVAAYGYKLLSTSEIHTIIILAFSHRKRYDGISIYTMGEFNTPLGNLKIDEELASLIARKNNRISFYPDLFREENSIELQLPFIKKVLPNVKIIPIAFGTSDYEDCRILSGVLAETLSSRNDVIIIASTDMSHFKSYAQTNQIDAETIKLMERFNYREIYTKGISQEQPCCGYMPVACLFMLAEKMGNCSFKVLKYANSGDTTGNKQQVVGYLSAVIYKSNQKPVTSNQKPYSRYC